MGRAGVRPPSVRIDSGHVGVSVGRLRVANKLLLAHVMSIIQTKVNASETCW